MSNFVTAQFVCHDSPGFTAMAPRQPLAIAICSGAILAAMKKHAHDFVILIDRAPQIILLAVDLEDDFIEKGRIVMALMLTLQSLGEPGTKPEPWCMAPHFYAALLANLRDGDRNATVRIIQEHIKKPLAEMVLFGALASGGGTALIRLNKAKDELEVLVEEEEEALAES